MAGRVPFPQPLPGIIWDIRSEIRPMAPGSERGIVIDMMPLSWFNPDEVIDIHQREWQSSFAITKLGVSAAMAAPDDEFDRDVQRSLLALMASGRVGDEPYGPVEALIFPQNTGGAKAQATQGDITWIAKKNGEAGNKITVNLVAQNGMYTLTTFFNAQRMYVQGFYDISQLKTMLQANMLIDAEYDETAKIALGEVMLEGGDNGTIPDYATRLQAFLDKASMKTWHTLSLAIAPDDPGYAQARTTTRSWLRQINIDLKEERHCVMCSHFGDENAGMDSDQIDIIFQDVEWNNDYWLGLANTVRLFAGRSAGMPANRSQTNRVINNVTAVRKDVYPLDGMTIRQQQDANNRGLFAVIENWDGRYKIQDDINSFVSWVPEKNLQWRSNRTKRGLHDSKVRINRMFDTQHKGRTSNNLRGRELILGDVDNVFSIQETEEIMQNHDISKLAVFPSETSPTAARIEARGIMYVEAISNLDFDMTITWG